jgi:hypothetical protein
MNAMVSIDSEVRVAKQSIKKYDRIVPACHYHLTREGEVGVVAVDIVIVAARELGLVLAAFSAWYIVVQNRLPPFLC